MASSFDSILEAILDGNAIVFLGAGFSRGATTVKGSSIKLGSELSAVLASKCGLPSDTPLDVAAELFQQDIGTDALIQLLRDEFTVKEVTPIQQAIVSLPWDRFYTTNYDDVIETALKQTGRTPQSVVLSDPLDAPKVRQGLCVHINGSVSRLHRESLANELKLTSSSYVTTQFTDSIWSQLFKSDVDLSRAIVFLGYSLYDLDIKRVLFASDERREKILFVVSKEAPKAQQRILESYGHVAPIGVDAFSQMCGIKQRTYIPSKRSSPYLTSFRELTRGDSSAPTLRDKDAFDLFLYGRCNTPAILAGTNPEHANGYYIDRALRRECWKRFQTGAPNVVIHSNLGNGKTMLAEGVLIEALRNGWKCFSLNDRRPQVADEVKYICEQQVPTLVAIESYDDHLDDVIKLFRLHRHDRLCLLFTTRSSKHDLYVDQLCQTLGVDDVFEMDANRVNAEDARRLVEVLDAYGLWGQHASDATAQKVDRVLRRCHGELQSVILDVFDAPQLRDKIRLLLRQLEQNAALRDLAILVMILQLLGKPADVDLLMRILGTDTPNQSTFRRDGTLREIISVSSGRIEARSAVLAEHLLRGGFTGANVLDVLKALIRYTHDNGDRSNEYASRFASIYAETMRFANVQAMFEEKGRLHFVREFYEYAKTLRRTQKDPHFWLQYAVGSLAGRDYSAAKQYFATAYALASKRQGYDPAYIDNHYARFLLETTIEKGEPETAMQYFNDAAEILLRQANRFENRHYPYRVAIKLEEFFNTFSGRLRVEERKRIVSVGKKILESMTRLDARLRNLRDVVECERRVLAMIEKAKKMGVPT